MRAGDERQRRPGRVDGLLGIDVLSRWVSTIDYGARRLLLALDAAACGSGAVRLPLVRGAGGLVATVDLGGGAGALHLVPDSGADRLVLFGPSMHALPPLTLLDTVRVRSILGDEPARLVRLDHLQVADIPLGSREALLLPDRPPGGVMGDGLLPLHLFGRATFDLAGSALWLEARR